MGIAGVELPGGLVTFLFTDIEGSTRLLSELGPGYDAVLDLHHETLREVWSAHRGHEVNTEGDAFFVSFASADDALGACIAAQRALADAPWPVGVDLRVRMGLHTGYAKPRNDDYTALAVNQAARVVGAAHGGQVLLTSETVAALGADAAAPISSLGRFRVRDFDGPVELFAIQADGWTDPGRPPRVRPADGHNLVPFLTSMVDRVDERALLGDQMQAGALVTIAGPGGGGKTRLAIEFGLDAARGWPDGVWFTDLSLVRGPEHVAEAIADAVGATPTPGVPVLEDAREHLRDRELLLITDNCEHVVDEVARVVHDLQSTCPGLGVLATSRIPLGLAHERVLRLDPLPYDADDSPAVQLFMATASELDADDLATVRQLCEQLDGIPLALELAAARTRSVPPSVILERLESDQTVVRTTDPTRPDRHRSLDRVLAWSWELLDDDARAALRRLSVLWGTFDLATAEVAVADEEIPSGQVAELVWTLLDHSLIVADVASGGSRYRVLNPVRSFAGTHTAPTEFERTVRALGQHFHHALGPDRVGLRSWASNMLVELDNVRGVITDLVDVDDERGLELAWSIGRFHDLVNAYATGAAEVSAALERHRARSPARVALLCLGAWIHLRMGGIDAAEPPLAEAETLAEELGTPPWDSVCVQRTRGEVLMRRGRAQEAADLAERTLQRELDDAGASRCWNLLGLAHAQLGTIDRALDAFTNELACARRSGNEIVLAKIHGNVAEAALVLGMDDRAARHQLEALEWGRANREPVQLAYSMMVAARMVARRGGDLSRAAMLQEAASQALARAGHVLYPVDAGIEADLRADIERRIGPDAYADAVAEGRVCSPEVAADLAQDVLEHVATQEDH